jgi:hypothetical protein
MSDYLVRGIIDRHATRPGSPRERECLHGLDQKSRRLLLVRPTATTALAAVITVFAVCGVG